MLRNLGYYSSLYGFTSSILDRAYINQLASADSSLSSYNIVLKASVIVVAYTTFRITGLVCMVYLLESTLLLLYCNIL